MRRLEFRLAMIFVMICSCVLMAYASGKKVNRPKQARTSRMAVKKQLLGLNRPARSTQNEDCNKTDPNDPTTCKAVQEAVRKLADLNTSLNTTNSLLSSIGSKLDTNNSKIDTLTNANARTQDLLQQQIKRDNELLLKTIQRRFDAIPREVMTNDLFKEELRKLREDILREVNRQ